MCAVEAFRRLNKSGGTNYLSLSARDAFVNHRSAIAHNITYNGSLLFPYSVRWPSTGFASLLYPDTASGVHAKVQQRPRRFYAIYTSFLNTRKVLQHKEAFSHVIYFDVNFKVRAVKTIQYIPLDRRITLGTTTATTFKYRNQLRALAEKSAQIDLGALRAPSIDL